MTQQYSNEAEKALLGSIFLNEDLLYEAVNKIEEEDFYILFHKRVFKTVIKLYKQNKGVDSILVIDDIVKDKTFADNNVSAKIMDILSNVATSDHFNYYLDIVKEKRKLRDLANLANEIQSGCTGSESSEEIQRKISTILNKNEDAAEIINISDCHVEFLDRYEDFKKGKREFFKTGFDNLDRTMGGFAVGSLNTVAAKTGAGKTTFALNVALKAALKNKNVLMFSLEVDIYDLINKLISSYSSIPYDKIRSCFMGKEQYDKYIKALNSLSELSLDFCDKGGLDIYKLIALVKAFNKKKKVDLIIVDNLQLITTKNYPNNKNLQTGEITSKLKALARDLQTHIILVSQLSREVSKQDRRPILADLRDSGSIEQDSDTVLFLYEDDIIISKNRHGRCSDIKVIFEGNYSRFREVEDNNKVPF